MATTRQLNVNGRTYNVDAESDASLLMVLRDHLDLTGSKYGCGEGQCGACTVLIEGKSRRSCITHVGDVAQKKITTIEGLAQGDRLTTPAFHGPVGQNEIASCDRSPFPISVGAEPGTSAGAMK